MTDEPNLLVPVHAVKRLTGRTRISTIELIAAATPDAVMAGATDRMFLNLAETLKAMFTPFIVGQRAPDGSTQLTVELLVIDPQYLMEQAHANQVQAAEEGAQADAGTAREADQQTH